MNTEEKADKMLNPLIDSIIRASKKTCSDDPQEAAKAEEYIRRKIADIYYVGKEIGKGSLIDEIFG